jgi:ankyrin repeat protein
MSNEAKTHELIDLFKNNVKPLKASAINKLIREGADINGIDSEFPLFYAVKNNNYQAVEYLIKNGADVNRSSIITMDKFRVSRFTSLHLACINGNKRIAELLINNRAEISAKDSNNNTPLMIATSHNRVDIVRMLIDRELLIPQSSASSSSASSASSASAIKLEVPSLNEKNNLGYTPLHIACENTNRELIELFVSLGADLKSAVNNGDKPIHILTKRHRGDLIEILINAEAIVNEKNDSNGETPLLMATDRDYNNNPLKRERTIQYLLSRGADPTIHDDYDVLPIHKVAENGEDIPSLLHLIEAVATNGHKYKGGFDTVSYINAKQEDGLTPLYIACIDENIKMVRELIMRGADPNILTDNDSSILGLLLDTSSDIELYSLILRAGADPNYIANENEHAPIVRAIWKGNPIIVKMLIDAGANMNHIDIDGNTPLMIACGVHEDYDPDIEIIITLLNSNVDVNIRSAAGDTALEILKQFHPDVAEKLSVYKTATVSYFLDPLHPRPMMSQIDAESTQNIKDYMGGNKKSKRRQVSKRRQSCNKKNKRCKTRRSRK